MRQNDAGVITSSQRLMLPLDYVSTSQIAAAWSLRKLRTAYVGALISIRRSSDNAVTDVSPDSTGVLSLTSSVSAGGNLGAWLGASNGFVAAYYDQGGNNNTLGNATLAQQAQIATAGAITIINSRPAPLYSGTQSYAAVNSPSLGMNTSMTAFFVVRYTSFSGAVSTLLDKRTTTGSTPGYHYYVSGAALGLQWNTAISGSAVVGQALSTGVTMGITYRATLGLNASFYKNRIQSGSSQTLNASGSSLNTVPLLIAGHSSGDTSLYLQGYLPECILINTSLVASTTMSAIVNDQRRFYGF
jgi:alpha-L-arabinofuranosidase B-like protein